MPDIVIIQEPDYQVVISDGNEVSIASPGPQGPPGAPGPASSGHFSHVQSTPSTAWAVNHNLGYRPNCEVLLDSGEVITGGVQVNHIDENSLTVSAGHAISGRAECS